MRRNYFAVFASIILVFAFVAPNLAYSETTRDKLWKEDLIFIRDNLKSTHKNLFFHLKESEYNRDFQNMISQVSESSDAKLAVMLQKAVAKINDPHTAIFYHAYGYIPETFKILSDGIFLYSARRSLIDAIGMKLLYIDGTPVYFALDKIRQIVATENDYWPNYVCQLYFSSVDVLFELGIIQNKEKFTYTFCMGNGTIKTFEIDATEHVSSVFKHKNISEAKSDELPLRWQEPNKYYFHRFIGENSDVLYVKYRSCKDQKEYPVSKLLEEIDQSIRKKFQESPNYKISKFIFDVRDNVGGDSRLFYPFWNKAKEMMRIGSLGMTITLINNSTCSSGTLNAFETKKLLGATLVGLPTGSKPYSWGPCKHYNPPNNRYIVISCAYSYVGDPNMTFENNALMPDIKVELRSNDYFNLKDPQLEAALNYAPEKNCQQVLARSSFSLTKFALSWTSTASPLFP